MGNNSNNFIISQLHGQKNSCNCIHGDKHFCSKPPTPVIFGETSTPFSLPHPTLLFINNWVHVPHLASNLTNHLFLPSASDFRFERADYTGFVAPLFWNAGTTVEDKLELIYFHHFTPRRISHYTERGQWSPIFRLHRNSQVWKYLHICIQKYSRNICYSLLLCNPPPSQWLLLHKEM